MLTCTKPEMVALLGGFICSTSDVRELKRALAVKMAYRKLLLALVT